MVVLNKKTETIRGKVRVEIKRGEWPFQASMNFVLTAAAAASASEKYFMRVSLFAKTAHLNIDSIGAWATARRSDYKLWMANIRDSMHREAAVKTKYGCVRKRNHHHFCDLL